MHDTILSAQSVAELIEGMDARGASKLIQCGILPGQIIGRGYFTNIKSIATFFRTIPTLRLSSAGRQLIDQLPTE